MTDEPNWKGFELYKPMLLGTIVPGEKKKKKAILHISLPITSELHFSYPSPPLLLDCSFFWLASQDKERES